MDRVERWRLAIEANFRPLPAQPLRHPDHARARRYLLRRPQRTTSFPVADGGGGLSSYSSGESPPSSPCPGEVSARSAHGPDVRPRGRPVPEAMRSSPLCQDL